MDGAHARREEGPLRRVRSRCRGAEEAHPDQGVRNRGVWVNLLDEVLQMNQEEGAVEVVGCVEAESLKEGLTGY